MAIDLGTTVTGERGGDVVSCARRREPEPAVVPLDVDGPRRGVAGLGALRRRRGRRAAAAGRASPARSTPTLPDRRRAVVVGGARGRGRAGARLRRARRSSWRSSASGPSSERPGVPCGIMDQLASAAGVDGHALRIDCTTLDGRPGAAPRRPRGGGRRLRRARASWRRAPTPSGRRRARPPQADDRPAARTRPSPTSSASPTTSVRRAPATSSPRTSGSTRSRRRSRAGDRARPRRGDGGQPRQPPRRLRGEHPGARRTSSTR